MSERMTIVPEGQTIQERLESMTPGQLLELKREALARYSDLESLINNINDVLDGYGIERKEV